MSNHYEQELSQAVRLFSSNVTDGDDIHLILYALKEVMGYQAFDSNIASQAEVDDLANRLKNYRDLRAFLEYAAEIKTGYSYCVISLPESKKLVEVRKAIESVRTKLGNLKDYIDSDVKLKTELIGHTPPVEEETGTIAAMIQEYASIYMPTHDSAVNAIDGYRKQIHDKIMSDDIRALKILEGITALQPANADALIDRLTRIQDELFECLFPSRSSVEDQLRAGPMHECGLSLINASMYVVAAEGAAIKVDELIDETFRRKMEVFLNPTVQKRLEQGKEEPCVAGLLACHNTDEMREYLVNSVIKSPGIVDIINKYLKRIVVKRVRMADFKPAVSTIQRDQIKDLKEEFSRFLESNFSDMKEDDDSLPMLQLE
jgi:hypothetical protein